MNIAGGKRKDILHTQDTIIQQIFLLFTAPHTQRLTKGFYLSEALMKDKSSTSMSAPSRTTG